MSMYLVYPLYYTVFEAAAGRTLGKFVTGTKVVDQYGNKPSTKDAFLRSLSRFVPFEPFSFLGNTARGWHDTWTNTYVVNAR